MCGRPGLACSRAAAHRHASPPDSIAARQPPLLIPLPLPSVNGASAVLSGTLRGSGRQKAGALANGACNYAVGLPLMLLLAFRLRLGVAGLWAGIAAGATLQACTLAVLVARFDWTHEAARADRLVRHLSQSSSSQRRRSLLDAPLLVEEPPDEP